ncbi:MAG: YidC/Oxa1 family membrane protein insertase [Lachnospiraceae bacterium]
MSGILLTQNTTFIIGPVAQVLGYIMDAIFKMIDMIGIPNVGLAIILFTIAINLIMLPLTIKQQKFSKFNAKMSPEIQAIQKKYKGKKDNDSMMAMNAETQEVYAKYGVSPTGSCLPLLIQMPILFSLYRVIYAMPAYVTQIKEAFFPLVNEIIANESSIELIKGFKNSTMFQNQFNNELFTSGNIEYIQNTIIDCLNKASSAEWTELASTFPNLIEDVTNTVTQLNVYNNFFGLNIADSPSYIITEAFATGSFLLIIGALIIPLLSAATQWFNTKLMPQASDMGGDPNNTMVQSMKTMNVMMPLMSAFFCFTLPAGMGIYWIASAVVRSIQQILINKHIDKMDMDEEIKKNQEKRKKKLEKAGIDPNKVNNYATMNTKAINTKGVNNSMSKEEKDALLKKSMDNNNYKPGSIASKANMVKQYNENNNKQ